MSAPRPVDSADAAWLRMDHPTNRMTIVAVLSFDGPLSVETMRSLVTERLLRFERFRSRVLETSDGMYWEPDPDFDVARHVETASLPPPGDDRALQTYVGDVMSAPLPEDRPPWHFTVADRADGGTSLVVRLHHGLADGIALIRVLLGLADGAEDEPPVPEPTGRDGSLALDIGRGVVQTVGTVVEESVNMILEPDRIFTRLRQGFGLATALGKFGLVGPDSPSPFRGPLTSTKRVAWSTPVPLEEVKGVARAFGGTVNDVLLTALAGGLRRFMAERGRVEPSVEIRSVVPVNLRPEDEPLRLGNRFGLVLLALPVGIPDPAARFALVQERMNRIKASMEPVVALGILQTLGNAPRAVQDAVIRRLSASSTAVMTNVPGPRKRLHFAGVPLGRVMFWVPRAGSIGLGISILSYAGEVVTGFAVDAGLVTDPTTIVRSVEAEWQAMTRGGDGRS